MIKAIQKIISSLKAYDFFESFKHASTYFSANILVQAIGMISLPIFTWFMDTEEYGITELFISMAKIALVLFSLSLYSSIARYYYEEKDDYREFIGTCFLFSTISMVGSSALMIIFRKPLAEWLELPPELFLWIIPFVIANYIYESANSLFIAQKKSMLVSKLQLVNGIARLVVVVIFFLLISEAYRGRIIGMVVSIFGLSCYIFYLMLPHIRIKIKFEHIRYMFAYSIPLIPYLMSSFILNYFDQFMINKTVGPDETGLYSYAYKLGMLMYGLLASIHQATRPDFFKWMNRGQFTEIRQQIKSMNKLIILGASFLILFAADIGSILAQKASFREALPIVPIIVISYVFIGIYLFYGRIIAYTKKTIYTTVIALIVGGLNIWLNYLFIPTYGYQAAAFTTMASAFIMMLLGVILFDWVLKEEYPSLGIFWQVFLYLAIVTGIWYGILALQIPYFPSLALRLLCFILVGLILFGGKLKAQYEEFVK